MNAPSKASRASRRRSSSKPSAVRSTRSYCMQHRESDFDFVSRLLADPFSPRGQVRNPRPSTCWMWLTSTNTAPAANFVREVSPGVNDALRRLMRKLEEVPADSQ
ncbi:contractile injection system protein, VgrG/Pvc8 family [Uliginosibacterium sp. 31-12]|uniref:contractile injection system protein, VgrG/Pvc8 family n=1 Tax=Uliginosibacterium sp. 31-12 TaxID=3062781 RepID=UPI0034C6CC58